MVKREGPRFIKQLFFELTPAGQDIADKYLDENDLQLLKSRNIDQRSLEFMRHLQDNSDYLYQMAATFKVYMTELTAVAERLSNIDMVRIFGQGRIQVELTEKGREMLKEAA